MKVKKNILLSEISSWKVGGGVKQLIIVESLDELKVLISQLTSNNENYAIIGETTNLLFTSEYIDGTLIKLSGDFNFIKKVNDDTIDVGAGCWVPKMSRTAMLLGLTGLEHTIGIPGSVGGLIRMNGGSQRKSISNAVVSVTCLNEKLEIIKLDNQQCNFDYRNSIFKNSKLIIISVRLNLFPGDKKIIRRECVNILSSRRKKFPKKMPNCGSVFKSNPHFYEMIGTPGYAIEKVEMKGYSIGDAQISSQHANFIINNGNAKSNEILELIKICQERMKSEFGFSLEPEVEYMDNLANITDLDSI